MNVPDASFVVTPLINTSFEIRRTASAFKIFEDGRTGSKHH